jgi:hypothetical protein
VPLPELHTPVDEVLSTGYLAEAEALSHFPLVGPVLGLHIRTPRNARSPTGASAVRALTHPRFAQLSSWDHPDDRERGIRRSPG